MAGQLAQVEGVVPEGIDAHTFEPAPSTARLLSQADVVFLFPDLSSAGHSEWTVAGPRRDGVIRMMYVGMTRARETLVLCDRASATAVHW